MLQSERDTFREDTKEINAIKTQLQQDTAKKMFISTTKTLKLEGLVKKLSDDNKAQAEVILKQEKDIKKLSDERENMKIRITKLSQRKGNFNSGVKTCKNCAMDYVEKENFNWSCRMHQSEWGGEMWWCCGKRGKDQPGCKFMKHETKDDEKINLDDKNS